jgi:catalase
MSINFPTFFVRDGVLGPDAIRSQQRNPASFEIDFSAMFDFMSLVPESMLANTWFWSDHGTPRGWMHMDG